MSAAPHAHTGHVYVCGECYDAGRRDAVALPAEVACGALAGVPPAEVDPAACCLCKLPLREGQPRVGLGDDDRFVHDACYWRERAIRAEERLADARRRVQVLERMTDTEGW